MASGTAPGAASVAMSYHWSSDPGQDTWTIGGMNIIQSAASTAVLTGTFVPTVTETVVAGG